MRRRAWVAWGLTALAFALGIIGQGVSGARPLNLLSGLAIVAAIVLGLSLLPWWGRWLPPLAPLPGLFTAPRASERWCPGCGAPTARTGACRRCGHTPVSFARN